MSEWTKSAEFGGIYASSLHAENYANSQRKIKLDLRQIAEKMEILSRISGTALQLYKQIQATIRKNMPVARDIYLSAKKEVKNHISQKQELYWPVLVAIVLLCFAFASRLAFAESNGAPNNLPIKNNPKLNVIGLKEKDQSKKLCFSESKNEIKIEKAEEIDEKESELQEDIAKIVGNTPMVTMIDSIAKKDRTVAAFIVGIAMKESKFGVYSPKVGGRDCYNYWGLKAGGKTVAGGYTCFNSPDEAVSTVSKTIEKMVAKGVRNPAQAISWKCGSSCAGHGAENVRKWIADVGINFYKINS